MILYSETVFRVCLIFYFLKNHHFNYVGEISHEIVFTVNRIYFVGSIFHDNIFVRKRSFDFVYILAYI